MYQLERDDFILMMRLTPMLRHRASANDRSGITAISHCVRSFIVNECCKWICCFISFSTEKPQKETIRMNCACHKVFGMCFPSFYLLASCSRMLWFMQLMLLFCVMEFSESKVQTNCLFATAQLNVFTIVF